MQLFMGRHKLLLQLFVWDSLGGQNEDVGKSLSVVQRRVFIFVGGSVEDREHGQGRDGERVEGRDQKNDRF